MLGRPHRVRPLLDSLRATGDHRALFITSPGDTAEHEALRTAGADVLLIDQPPGPGDYARKINAGYCATDAPLIFLAADDLHFHPGWADAATAYITAGVGVVGTNDLGNARVIAGQHATHSLVTRAYADRFGTIDESGKILHEGYRHNFVDDELVATAKKRNAWAFARESVVEHLHPHWAKGTDDETYRLGQSGFAADRQHHHRRRRLWM